MALCWACNGVINTVIYIPVCLLRAWLILMQPVIRVHDDQYSHVAMKPRQGTCQRAVGQIFCLLCQLGHPSFYSISAYCVSLLKPLLTFTEETTQGCLMCLPHRLIKLLLNTSPGPLRVPVRTESLHFTHTVYECVSEPLLFSTTI